MGDEQRPFCADSQGIGGKCNEPVLYVQLSTEKSIAVAKIKIEYD